MISSRNRDVRTRIKQLKDPNRFVRSRAAEALGDSRNRLATRPLIAALQDPEWLVVLDAVEALGTLRDPRAIAPLLKTALRKEKMLWSHIAVHLISIALYKIGRSSLRPALTTLQRRNRFVRAVAAATLARFADRTTTPALIMAIRDTAQDVRQWAQEGLKDIGRPALRALVEALKQPDRYFKAWPSDVGVTASALARFGEEAVPSLLHALTDQHVESRCGAAAALGEVKSQAAVGRLVTALLDDVPRVRRQSAVALGKIGDRRAVRPLIFTLGNDGSHLVRDAAARALWDIRDPTAVPALIAALEDPHLYVRWAAAGALGAIGDRRAVGPLCLLLSRSAESRSGWEGSGGPANALARLKDRRAVGPLIDALQHPHAETRWGAAHALGQLGDAHAVRPLIDVIKSRSPDAPKGAAIFALGNIGDRRALPILRTASRRTRIPHGQKFAVEAIAKILGSAAVDFLVDVLKQKNRETYSQALDAFHRIPPRVILPTLLQLLDSNLLDLQWLAAEALVKIQHPRAVKFLLEKCDQGSERSMDLLGRVRSPQVVRHLITQLDGDHAAHAARALPQIGRLATGPLIQVATGQDDSARWWAVSALGGIQDARAVPTLLQALAGDEHLREPAAEALSQIGGQRATAALMNAWRARDLQIIAGAYPFFMRLGKAGSQEMLISALPKPRYGFPADSAMAVAFIKSGDAQLARAGRRWLRQHGDLRDLRADTKGETLSPTR